jgi:hypothetical protein
MDALVAFLVTSLVSISISVLMSVVCRRKWLVMGVSAEDIDYFFAAFPGGRWIGFLAKRFH